MCELVVLPRMAAVEACPCGWSMFEPVTQPRMAADGVGRSSGRTLAAARLLVLAWCGLVVMGVLLGAGEVARAQPAPAVTLRWVAPRGCPVEADVRAALARAIGTDVIARGLTVDASVKRRGRASFVAQLRFAGVLEAERTLAGDRCAALADASVWLIADVLRQLSGERTAQRGSAGAAARGSRRDASSANEGRDVAAAAEGGGAGVSRRDGAVTSSRDATSASGRDGTSSSSRDGAVTSSHDGASSSSRDGAVTSSRDGASSSSRDGASALGRDGSVTSSRDGASALGRVGVAAPTLNAVESDRPGGARPAAPEPFGVDGTAGAGSRVGSDVAPDVTRAAEAKGGGTARDREDVAVPGWYDVPQPSAADAADAGPRGDVEPRGVAPPRAARGVGLGLALWSWVDSSTLPAAAFGPGVEVALTWSAWRLALRPRLWATWSALQPEARSALSVRMWAAELPLQACYVWGLPGWGLAGCGSLVLGLVHATAEGAPQTRAALGGMLAAEAALRALFELPARLQLHLEAALARPWVAPQLVVEPVGVVHEPAPLAVRAGLALGLHF